MIIVLPCQALNSCAEVPMVPYHGVVHLFPLGAHIADDHLAGVDADPRIQHRFPLVGPLLLKLSEFLAHGESAPHGPLRMIGLADRRSPKRPDGVTDEL